MEIDRKSKEVHELTKRLRKNYSRLPQDDDERIMDQIQKLLIADRRSAKYSRDFLQEMGELISRFSGFLEILIALKTGGDDKFRY